MPLLSAAQVADAWIGAGGPRNRAVEWVAIAMGESGLVTDAVSPAGAIGLWQIMPFNAAPNGATVSQLYDPNVNAHVAVAMSGGGTNCAAWDSCYRDINASGRYTFLGWPEQGSADYNNMAAAAAELQGQHLGGGVPPSYPGLTDDLTPTVAHLQGIAHRWLPAVQADTRRVTAVIDRMYRAGWRP